MCSLKNRNEELLRRALAEADLPLRILVQTRSGLIRGENSTARRRRVSDIVARAVWDRNSDPTQETLRSYRALWSRPRMTCWFLVDHAFPQVGSDVPDESIPILWYLYDGEWL